MATESLREILTCLPHRYPFLMVDRVISWEPGKKLVAIKNVTFNEPHFMGHFPDNPVMPGVLILEAMAQAGALFAHRTDPEAIKGRLIYFMSIEKARFRKPVVPGDQLRIEMELKKRRGDVWRFLGQTYVDSDVVAEAEVMAMTREQGNLDG
ncbi:MAG: 3-hydroxyacyl-ACP dehydratase FabZ [Magnetococcales bacterium]|nr:3-hydroxyacyl-ACP dehydratase FabZ [Magnetococcales bacterium]